MSELPQKKIKRIKSSHSRQFGKALGTSNEEEYKYLEKAILGTPSEVYERTICSDDEDESPTGQKVPLSIEKRAPAWIDEEDDKFTFNEVLEKQKRKAKKDASGIHKHHNVMEKKFKEIMGVPKWAKLPKEKKDPQDNLQNHCGEFLKKPKFLKKDTLEIEKLIDLNHETKSEGPIISVLKFHTKSMVAMVAGSSGIVSLFQVDGKENKKLHSIHFQNYPIYCGSFMKNGDEFMIGSRHYRHFYCHDMITGKSTKVDNSKVTGLTKTKNFCVSPRDDLFAVCGNTGTIHLFTVRTKEFIDTFQMNCSVVALSFNGDGSILYSHGTDGEVYAWDMKTRRCVKKLIDDGCLKGTALATSKDNHFLATGSSSGVVNIYGSEHLDPSGTPLPQKTIYNLVTPITGLLFNSTGEILAASSNHKEAALKLVHIPSMSVFSNFPPFHCTVKKPFSLDFSVNSGFFGVGDNQGIAHLYRLKHYGNY